MQTFKSLEESAKKHIGYYTEGVILSFTEGIVARMEELNISKTQLALKIGCKPPYITKILRGQCNLTLESMVKLALALSCELNIDFSPLPGQAGGGAQHKYKNGSHKRKVARVAHVIDGNGISKHAPSRTKRVQSRSKAA